MPDAVDFLPFYFYFFSPRFLPKIFIAVRLPARPAIQRRHDQQVELSLGRLASCLFVYYFRRPIGPQAWTALTEVIPPHPCFSLLFGCLLSVFNTYCLAKDC